MPVGEGYGVDYVGQKGNSWAGFPYTCAGCRFVDALRELVARNLCGHSH